MFVALAMCFRVYEVHFKAAYINVIIWYMPPNVLKEKYEILCPFSAHVIWAVRGALWN